MSTAGGIGDAGRADDLARWKQGMMYQQAQMGAGAANRRAALDRASRERIAGRRLAFDKAKQASKGGGAAAVDAKIAVAEEAMNHFTDMAAIAKEAQKRTKISTTGYLSPLKYVPGTGARELEEFLEPLRSQEALTKLNTLREQAAAIGAKGSGLGQVTEREIKLLMGARRSLDTAQGEKQIDAALKHLQAQYERSMQIIGAELEKLRNDPHYDEIAPVLDDTGEDEDDGPYIDLTDEGGY
jgi:hypothetical protein